MLITFLGTGTSQGIPIIGSEHPVCHSLDAKDTRTRSSILIEINGLNLLVDTGPDLRQQFLDNKKSAVDAILYTHEHADHTAGLDDIRPIYFIKKTPIPLYAEQRTLNSIKKRFDYAFTEHKYPGVPSFDEFVIDETPFIIQDITIIPIRVIHGSLPILGYRIGDFAYITDAKTIDSKELDKLKGLDVLVINTLREEEHASHLNLSECLEYIKILQPKKTYLTHISHLFGFHKEISQNLPQNVFLSYDGLEIEV